MVKTQLVLLTLIFLFIQPFPYNKAEAGGWTLSKNASYFQINYGRFATQSEFGLDGKPSPLLVNFTNLLDGKFNSQSFFLYSEYGIEEGLTLVVSSSFQNMTLSYNDVIRDGFSGQIIDTLSRTISSIGIGDTRIFGRFLIGQSAYGAISIQAGLKIPTGSATSSIPLGTGEIDVEGILQGGIGFPFINHLFGYATLDVGYRLRNGEAFNDELFLNVTAGVPIAEPLTIKFSYMGLFSQGTIRPIPQGVNVLNNYNLNRIHLGSNLAINDRIGFSIDAFTDIAGKNVAEGTTILFGINLRNF